MITTKKMRLLIAMYLSTLFAVGQSPTIDPNWQIQTGTSGAVSDEFNGSSVNTSLWHVFNCGDCCSWGGAEGWNSAYTSESGGDLNFKVDGTTNCFSGGYNTGGIYSLANYTYGYLEMSAQLPGYIDGSGVAHADKFWPAFWMYYTGSSPHYEIDMMDQCCCCYKDAETTGAGWQCNSTVDNCAPGGSCTGNCQNVSSSPLCNSFHKYAVEWNANRVVFYRDDVPWKEDVINPSLSWLSMRVVIDCQLSSACNFYSGATWPEYMKMDYFRYYKLNLDCSNGITFLDDAQISSFTYAVKSSIYFGNGSGPINFGSCTNPLGISTFVFRAVNGFIFQNYGYTTTVPLGTSLMLVPSACN